MIKTKQLSMLFIALFFMLTITQPLAELIPYDYDLIEKNYADKLEILRAQEGESFLDKKRRYYQKSISLALLGSTISLVT